MSESSCYICGITLPRVTSKYSTSIDGITRIVCKPCYETNCRLKVITGPIICRHCGVKLASELSRFETSEGMFCRECYDNLGAANVEADPNGKDPHEPGAKLDAGKLKIGLVLSDFANALEAVAKIGTDGAEKYTEHGWLTVPNGRARYTDAMLRHYLKESTEGGMDPSGSLHAAHLAWNALARLELQLRGLEK